MGARVDLTGVFHRITLSLAQVAQFKEGTVIPVPYAALEGLQIEAIGRRRVATARLGQSHGMRALRVRPMEDSELESGERAGEGYRFAAPSEARDGARAPLVAGVPEDPLGGLSALGDLPPMGDLPPLGDLPALGDLPPMGDLPPLGDLPPFGELPALDDLPPLKVSGM